tara:strand:- start:1203 stop:1328 length:126 start_codon:yes stop_codon:yes gene_type:complete
MPISFKNFKKMVSKNPLFSKKAKEKALKTYKRRFKKVQKKL